MTRDLKDIGPSEFALGPENAKSEKNQWGRKVRSLSVALFVLVCTGLIIYGASRGVPLIHKTISGSPYFRLGEVEVIGTKNADRDEISAAIGLGAGAPIVETDLAAVRERLISVDWVKDARVQRKLPNRLVITIVEHTPVGVVATDTGYRFVDPDGELARIDAGLGGYPTFFGMKTKKEFADGAMLALTLYEKGIIAAGFLGSVEYDAYTGYMISTREGVRLRFGPSPFEQKIERLITVLPDAERRGPIEYILLNIEGQIIVKNGTPVM